MHAHRLLLTGASLLGALLAPGGRGAASAQIVDPFSTLPSTGEGLGGEVEVRAGAETGNTELVSVGAGVGVGWGGGSHRWRLLGDYARTDSDGEKLSESAYGHLRHNLELAPSWFTLAFLQVQHEPFQRLSLRTLAGAGIRLDFVRQKQASMSLGISPMLEIEDPHGEETESRGRLSTFLHIASEGGAGTRLDAAVFVQPRLDDVGDFRVLARSSARVGLGGPFSLVLRFGLTHDSEPPAEVDRTDTETRVGLVWSIG